MPEGRAYRPALIMALSYIIAQLMALLIIPLYPSEYRVFQNVNDPMNPIYYAIMIFGVTAVFLLLAKKGLDMLIKWFMIFSVWATIIFALYPLIFFFIPIVLGYPGLFVDIPFAISMAVGTILAGALYVNPEWYIIDITGIFMGAGIIAIFGLSFGVLPALILLIIMAAYDFISVYRTKHMIDLADTVLETKLPIIMVAPKKKDYSFVEDTIKIKKESRGGGEEREAMFMGLGDIIIPGILSASVYLNSPPPYNLPIALSIIGFSFLGYLALLHFVFKGKAQAGLPFLNTGAIAGYLIASYVLTGNPLYGVVWWW